MTDADHVRAQIDEVLDLSEKVTFSALAFQDTISRLQRASLLLDLGSGNAFSRSVVNLASSVGKEIGVDLEFNAQLATELRIWRERV